MVLDHIWKQYASPSRLTIAFSPSQSFEDGGSSLDLVGVRGKITVGEDQGAEVREPRPVIEDDGIMEAMENPRIADELSQQVFTKQSDIEAFGDIIADPTQTFVNNTTCATCHRLTAITFDFHTFSYFEEREATISPRVVEDVSNDLRILRAFLETWPR